MQAFAPAPPIMAVPKTLMRPAQTFSAQNPFQTVLQRRLVAHLKREGAAPLAPKMPKTQRFSKTEPQAGVNQPTGSGISRRAHQSRGRLPNDWRLPPERFPEISAALLQAGFPPERLQALLADPQVQEQGLSLADVRRAWQEALATASSTSPMAAGAQPQQISKVLPGEPLTPALASLLELIKQSPGGVLPVPASRQPEIVALLSEAGLSPAQVEALLGSPRVQEHGLTAEVIQAAWMRATQSFQGEGKPASQSEIMWQVTDRADYQRVWERLRLPTEALPDLRLALQQMGASPEALAGLEEQVTPQGVPVGQVWQIIKQCLKDGQAAITQDAAAPSGRQAPLSPPPSGQEVEQWRQLLLQTGFTPEVVDGLLGMQSPGSAGELRARLAALAPSTAFPKTQEAPNHLYLPESLRLRSLWWENRTGAEAGLGEREENQTDLSHFGKSWSPQTLAAENQEGFASWLTPLAASSSAPGEVLGGSGLGQLNPEVRQAFWSQLEAGILGNLKPGENRLNLVLDPPHLGQIELTLNLKGDSLAITAMITRPEVAHLAGAGVEQLVQALSQHGLVLSQFQVHVQKGWPHGAGLLTAGEKMAAKKEHGSGGGEPTRRRRAPGVDRFV
jgi:hypothetical protein